MVRTGGQVGGDTVGHLLFSHGDHGIDEPVAASVVEVGVGEAEKLPAGPIGGERQISSDVGASPRSGIFLIGTDNYGLLNDQCAIGSKRCSSPNSVFRRDKIRDRTVGAVPSQV